VAQQVAYVDYLRLGDPPQLVAQACDACGARFFDRRNACAACSATSFHEVALERQGTVVSFTIVTFAAPGVAVPYVAAVVDLGGTSVRGIVVDVEPTPEAVHLGMAVELTTVVVGVDAAGTEAINYGFRPLGGN